MSSRLSGGINERSVPGSRLHAIHTLIAVPHKDDTAMHRPADTDRWAGGGPVELLTEPSV